jgi:hypothetical protein
VSEAHTADLGTRYRYRREGAEAERERVVRLLEADLELYKTKLSEWMASDEPNASYEARRFANYVLALDDFMDHFREEEK